MSRRRRQESWVDNQYFLGDLTNSANRTGIQEWLTEALCPVEQRIFHGNDTSEYECRCNHECLGGKSCLVWICNEPSPEMKAAQDARLAATTQAPRTRNQQEQKQPEKQPVVQSEDHECGIAYTGENCQYLSSGLIVAIVLVLAIILALLLKNHKRIKPRIKSLIAKSIRPQPTQMCSGVLKDAEASPQDPNNPPAPMRPLPGRPPLQIHETANASYPSESVAPDAERIHSKRKERQRVTSANLLDGFRPALVHLEHNPSNPEGGPRRASSEQKNPVGYNDPPNNQQLAQYPTKINPYEGHNGLYHIDGHLNEYIESRLPEYYSNNMLSKSYPNIHRNFRQGPDIPKARSGQRVYDNGGYYYLDEYERSYSALDSPNVSDRRRMIADSYHPPLRQLQSYDQQEFYSHHGHDYAVECHSCNPRTMDDFDEGCDRVYQNHPNVAYSSGQPMQDHGYSHHSSNQSLNRSYGNGRYPKPPPRMESRWNQASRHFIPDERIIRRDGRNALIHYTRSEPLPPHYNDVTNRSNRFIEM